METKINFLLVGVGGQGTILASDILAEVGASLGHEVKKAEVHGMSQRGGSVVSHVRWGVQVFSPIIAKGQADILVAFEKLEAARFATSFGPAVWR
jgi:indolepyruvate ferredoxin oxidoreductase beta subunit